MVLCSGGDDDGGDADGGDGDDDDDDDDDAGVRGREAEVPQTREGAARLPKGRSRCVSMLVSMMIRMVVVVVMRMLM